MSKNLILVISREFNFGVYRSVITTNSTVYTNVSQKQSVRPH
jgi:hypothetical protein